MYRMQTMQDAAVATVQTELSRWARRNSDSRHAGRDLARQFGKIRSLVDAALTDCGDAHRMAGIEPQDVANTVRVDLIGPAPHCRRTSHLISISPAAYRKAATPPDPDARPKRPPRKRDHRATYRRRNERAVALGYSSYYEMRRAKKAGSRN